MSETGNRTDSHAFSLYMLVTEMFALLGESQSGWKSKHFINPKTYNKDEKEFIYFGGFLS